MQQRLRSLEVVGPGGLHEVRGGVLQVVGVEEPGVLLHVIGPEEQREVRARVQQRLRALKVVGPGDRRFEPTKV